MPLLLVDFGIQFWYFCNSFSVELSSESSGKFILLLLLQLNLESFVLYEIVCLGRIRFLGHIMSLDRQCCVPGCKEIGGIFDFNNKYVCQCDYHCADSGFS